MDQKFCETYMHHQGIVNVNPKRKLLFTLHLHGVNNLKTLDKRSVKIQLNCTSELVEGSPMIGHQICIKMM